MFSKLPGGVIAHTDYDWNKSGTRIRCTLEECREVFSVTTAPGDVDEADELFYEHQRATIQPAGSASVPVELAALRILRDTLHEVIADLSHDVSPLVVQAKLTKVLAEAQHAVALADGKIFGPGAGKEVEAEPVPAVAAPEPELEAEPSKPSPEPEPVVEASEPVVPDPATDEDQDQDQAAVLTLVPVPETTVEPEAVIEDLGVDVGDRVLATFRTPRQGDFTLEATVVKGLGLGQLIVGSWVISSSGVRSQHLLDIKVLASAGDHEHPIKGVFEASEHLGTGV